MRSPSGMPRATHEGRPKPTRARVVDIHLLCLASGMAGGGGGSQVQSRWAGQQVFQTVHVVIKAGRSIGGEEWLLSHPQQNLLDYFFFFFLFLFSALLCLRNFPDQESNPCPLQWKHVRCASYSACLPRPIPCTLLCAQEVGLPGLHLQAPVLWHLLGFRHQEALAGDQSGGGRTIRGFLPLLLASVVVWLWPPPPFVATPARWPLQDSWTLGTWSLVLVPSGCWVATAFC